MGKLVFGMMQSLDGYVAGVAGGPQLPPPGAALHRYFNDHVRGRAEQTGGWNLYAATIAVDRLHLCAAHPQLPGTLQLLARKSRRGH